MASQRPATDAGDADISKALQELARGEQTASAMENKLTALEQKIDALLASAESQVTPNGEEQESVKTSEESRTTGGK
ncbi:MAG: hypothetical protein Q9170_000062 [Blastenia crenularia]